MYGSNDGCKQMSFRRVFEHYPEQIKDNKQMEAGNDDKRLNNVYTHLYFLLALYSRHYLLN